MTTAQNTAQRTVTIRDADGKIIRQATGENRDMNAYAMRWRRGIKISRRMIGWTVESQRVK